MTNDIQLAELKMQLEEVESGSAEKDTELAKYEAIVKENEGENVW